jgi:serine/threonine protein kinase/tetratricopeptide (TPR) repeat protein
VVNSLDFLKASLADRYRIERELGRGGMATVYLAHDLHHDRPVALKLLRPELAATLGPERFLHEIRVAAKLQHPHIVPVFDSGEAGGGQLWYTMPYVEGETLRQRLDREKQLPLDDARRIVLQVLSALEYAHGHGVIHRDIKPENILLEDDQAVVTDLGIARAMSAIDEERLTETGLSLGTPSYMSPEQACAEPNIDRRTDIYSLGCVLYEMLAGEPPYTGPTPQAIVARRLTEPPPRLRTIRDVPESLEQAIHRALGRNPADRFATARDFARAITETETPTPRPAWSRPTIPAARRRLPKAIVGALLLAVILGLAWIAFQRSASTVLPVSATRLAVLPFEVRGSGSFSYLAEGMVDLLSRDLDGAGELRTIDAGTVLTAAGQNNRDGILDVERGRTIARRVGAGLYVLGSIHAVGGRVRIQAALYDGAGTRAGAETQATVEGDSARLFELVDRLSAQLLVKRGRGPVSRLAETAAITTRSLVALKAYLDAERRLRAASLQPARLDSAIAMFQQAVIEDSTFALAHYRMAVAAGWANRPGMSTAAARRALTSSARLTERDRRLLTAYVDFRQGAANRAERQYLEILRDYPDDLEALFQLGDVLYNYNPLRGRPRGEARELFNQVLDLDPGFL